MKRSDTIREIRAAYNDFPLIMLKKHLRFHNDSEVVGNNFGAAWMRYMRKVRIETIELRIEQLLNY